MGGGNTWIAPLFYAVDTENNFYFISDKNSIHTQHIKKNSQVAVSIFESREIPEKSNGLQIKAVCHEAKLTQLPHVIKTYFAKRFTDLVKARVKRWHNPRDYLGIAKYRFYIIVPQHFYILDPAVTDEDRRIEVKLSS